MFKFILVLSIYSSGQTYEGDAVVTGTIPFTNKIECMDSMRGAFEEISEHIKKDSKQAEPVFAECLYFRGSSNSVTSKIH